MTSDLQLEINALIEFIETGLLSPHLNRRLAHFPEPELQLALRDLLDWLSLRCILRGRTAALGSHVHPLTGRVLARLEHLSRCLCVPENALTYRVEVAADDQARIEDFVKDRIWHPQWLRPSLTRQAPPGRCDRAGVPSFI